MSQKYFVVTSLFLFIVSPFSPLVLATVDDNQKSLNKSLSIEHKTQLAGQKSQKKVDRLAQKSRQLLAEYQRLLQQGEYQKSYNQELRVLQQEQFDDIESLKQQLADLKITQQRLLPLLRDMTSTLEQFIELDIPFQKKQRLASVQELSELLSRSQVGIAEKFRRVMELYQAENDMNYNLEVARESVTFAGQTLSVDVLRVGRSNVYWQTLDQQQSAIWSAVDKKWLLLEASQHLPLRQAIRVANKDSAPALLALPVLLEMKVQTEAGVAP